MTFKLEINCDNAAFEDSPQIEVGRILAELAPEVESAGNLYDINGNRVGQYAFKGKQPK